MTATAPTLEVVDVYRRCEHCREWKPLKHFLIHQPSSSEQVNTSVHTCAGCRIRAHD